MHLRPAVTLLDAYRLMRIRNACYGYMTRRRRPIGLLEQWRWWRTHRERYRPFLAVLHGRVIGFGMVTDGEWLTGALLPHWQDCGLGRKLFKEIIARCPTHHPKLEVLENNGRAISLYLSLGFKEEGCKDGVLTMKL